MEAAPKVAAAAKAEAVAKVEVEVTTEVAARDKAMPEDGLRRQGTRQAEADRTSDAPHICAAAIENVTAVDKIRRRFMMTRVFPAALPIERQGARVRGWLCGYSIADRVCAVDFATYCEAHGRGIHDDRTRSAIEHVELAERFNTELNEGSSVLFCLYLLVRHCTFHVSPPAVDGAKCV